MRVLLCLIALGVATNAGAEDVSTVVRYGDLNLANPAGVTTLDHRLRAAVASACRTGHTTLADRIDYQACLKAARTSANAGRETAMATVASSTRLASIR